MDGVSAESLVLFAFWVLVVWGAVRALAYPASLVRRWADRKTRDRGVAVQRAAFEVQTNLRWNEQLVRGAANAPKVQPTAAEFERSRAIVADFEREFWWLPHLRYALDCSFCQAFWCAFVGYPFFAGELQVARWLTVPLAIANCVWALAELLARSRPASAGRPCSGPGCAG